MQELWRWSNLGLAFVVELVALGIFAFWGWRFGSSTPVRLLLAVGLPVLPAVIWGLFAAPTANHGGPVVAAIVKIAVFGLAGLALWNLDHRVLGMLFVLVVAANLLIIRAGGLEPETPAASSSRLEV
ncbi:YrdB family protein [Pseudonocardia sp. CA-142604]|uniref:YrdB family protein n=1 Tax=Pseudonocardia sp. CA-142604 TaxID=3240024 RepID=UPI003D8BF4AD